MKGNKDQITKQLFGLWKNKTKNDTDKKNDIKINNNEVDRDMGVTHTPTLLFDLTGMNREQAKEAISKHINEKLEMVSHLELSEMKIDYQERERQREIVEEQIKARRSRRNQKHHQDHHQEPSINGAIKADEAIKTAGAIKEEEAIKRYEEHRHTSIFDIIQPEAFPYELQKKPEPTGQTKPLKTVEPTGQTKPLKTVELTDQTKPLKTVELTDQTKPLKAAKLKTRTDLDSENGSELLPEQQHINTSLDETIDRVFEFYGTHKARLITLCKKILERADNIPNSRIYNKIAKELGRINQRSITLVLSADAKLGLSNKATATLQTLVQKEKKISAIMCGFIDAIDKVNEVLVARAVRLKDWAYGFYNHSRDYAETHKKKLLVEFGIVVVVTSMITIAIGSMTSYEYIYNGKTLGYVKNQEDVYQTIDIIGDKLSQEYDAEISIDKDKDISFKKVIAFGQVTDDKDDILDRLTYMRNMKANGHGIFVDDKMVAMLESEETARAILTQVKNQYIKKDSNIQYKKVGFQQKVVVKSIETKLGSIEKKDEALEYIMTGAVEKKIHVVQKGETFSEIAGKYGLSQDQLLASNPKVTPEDLKIDQELCLNQVVPLITVQTVEIAKYKQSIPYEIAYENTGSLYKNEQTVKSRGSNGEKDVVAEVVRNNGIEVTRTAISSTVLTEPVSQVVLVGTKALPPLIGTGTLIYPIRGTLTSRYGSRWGRLHSGIDLAAPIGTYIKASDGGKVTFAGYNGALGYMIEINHGGGRVTWYGHCSKLFVKRGDKVFQGQHIANVGNTGHSTGPHVHFEVHVNGRTKNPLSYL